MDNIKSRIYLWPDDDLRIYCDEIIKWQRMRVLPKDSLLLYLANEYDIDTRELEFMIINEADKRHIAI